MKRLIVICALVAFMVVFGPTAKAVTVNPANWAFQLETYGTSASWTSDSNVPKNFPQYDYEWELTEAKLYVDILGELDVLSWIPEGDRSGSGTEPEVPFDIFGVADPLHIEFEGIITADIYLIVDTEGWGQAYIPSGTLSLGIYANFEVQGALFGGTLNVTAVPEPCTLLLLGLGAVMLRKRR